MTTRLANRFLSLVLSAILAVGPSLAQAREAMRPKLSVRMVQELQNGNYSRDLTIARYGTSRELSLRATQLRTAAGHSVANDVFQATLIMFAAATAQLAKDRWEKDRILAGHKYEDVQKATVEAAQQLFCGSKSTSVSSEILCSGEVILGIPGGWLVRGAAEFTVMAAIRYLLQSHPTRAALINLVGTMATSFIMLGGFMLAGHLWTEAVRVAAVTPQRAIDEKIIERAHNMFGRAVIEKVSGNWHNFSLTEDGKLAGQIFENMYNILLTDSKLRSNWIYNTWRFGLARGELIVNLTVLMGALSVGTSVGGGLATLVGFTGAPAWLISFGFASAFGLTVSAAMVYFPDMEIGKHITEAIQAARKGSAQMNHSLTRNQLSVASASFGNDRFVSPAQGMPISPQMVRYKKMWERRFLALLPALRSDREAWLGIAMERYYELGQKVEEAEGLIEIIKAVLKESKLRSALQVNEGGEIMSLAEARKKYCPVLNSRTGTRQDCEFPLSYQLKKLETTQALVREAKAQLETMAREMLETYHYDSETLVEMADNSKLQFSPETAIALRKEMQLVRNARDVLIVDFAAVYPKIAEELEINLGSPAEQKLTEVGAKSFFRTLYMIGMSELDVTQGLLRVAAAGGAQ